jgi:WD40 repeat protein
MKVAPDRATDIVPLPAPAVTADEIKFDDAKLRTSDSHRQGGNNPLSELVVREKEDLQALQKLLYALLPTLPMDLIKIIVAYDCHVFDGKLERAIQLGSAKINRLVPLSHNMLAGVMGKNDEIKIWDCNDGACLKKYMFDDFGKIDDVLEASDDLLVVSFPSKKYFGILNIKNDALEKGEFPAGSESIADDFIRVSDGRIAVSFISRFPYKRKIILIINVKTINIEQQLNKFFISVSKEFRALTSKWAVLASRFGLFEDNDSDRIQFWDLKTNIRTKTHEVDETPEMHFVPLSDNLCAILTFDNIKIFDVKTGSCIGTITVDGYGLKKMFLLSNGWIVVMASLGRIWVMNPVKPERKFRPVDLGFDGDQNAEISDCAVLSNGNLATVLGNEIKIWS